MCEEKQNTRCSFELISFHHFLSLSCSNAFMSWYQILWFNKVKPFLQNVNKVWKDYSLHYRHDMRWLFLKSLQLEFRSLIFAPFSACISLSYFLTMNLYAHSFLSQGSLLFLSLLFLLFANQTKENNLLHNTNTSITPLNFCFIWVD